MKTTRWQRRMGHKAVIYIGALMACLFCVFPFYYAIISSLRGPGAVYARLFPGQLALG